MIKEFIEEYLKEGIERLNQLKKKDIDLENYLFLDIYNERKGRGIFIDINSVQPREIFYSRPFSLNKISSYAYVEISDYYDHFIPKLKKMILNKMRKLKKYIGDKNTFIHMSNNPINLESFTEVKGNILNDINFYNPMGLWFSCNYDYYTWWLKTLKDSEDFNDIMRYKPFYIYELDYSKMKIKIVNNCQQFFAFNKKYKNDKDLDNYLDWERVYKDYDGLQLCPYPALKCNSYFRKKAKNLENTYGLEIDDSLLLSVMLNNQMSENDRSVLWSYYWKASSGVIWKNYSKLKLTEIDI